MEVAVTTVMKHQNTATVSQGGCDPRTHGLRSTVSWSCFSPSCLLFQLKHNELAETNTTLDNSCHSCAQNNRLHMCLFHVMVWGWVGCAVAEHEQTRIEKSWIWLKSTATLLKKCHYEVILKFEVFPLFDILPSSSSGNLLYLEITCKRTVMVNLFFCLTKHYI